ncbi:hypothetical protein K1719_043370 [Acacia pycnantha]|nr:hypothetical protein K1719_043370 [Acacia pycnantha]
MSCNWQSNRYKQENILLVGGATPHFACVWRENDVVFKASRSKSADFFFPLIDFEECVDSNPKELASYMATALNKYGILYLHMVEPKRKNDKEKVEGPDTDSLVPIRNPFNGTFITAGGYKREDGNKAAIVENKADLVAYDPVIGYTDYPFLEDNS